MKNEYGIELTAELNEELEAMKDIVKDVLTSEEKKEFYHELEDMFTPEELQQIREEFENLFREYNEFVKPTIIDTYSKLSHKNDNYLNPKFQKKFAQKIQHLEREALEFFQTELNNIRLAISYAKEDQQWKRVIDLSENLRKFLTIRTYWQELEQIQKDALEAAKKAENRLAQAHILNQLGEIDRLRGRAREGISKCEESIIIFQSLNDEYGEAKALYTLGYLNRSLGEFEKSANAFEEALNIFRIVEKSENIDIEEEIADSLDGLGQIYTRQGKLEQAKEALLESLNIKKSLENQFSTSKTYNNLGKVYIEFYNQQKQLKYLEEAKKLFESSLEIKRELGDRQGQGASFNELGKVHRLMGKYEKALDYYNRSLNIKSQVSAGESPITDRHGEGLTYMEIGLLYEERGDDEKTRNYFQLALDHLNNYSPEFKEIAKKIQETDE
jgi:tetratricopeptide (TPR) repeat protein